MEDDENGSQSLFLLVPTIQVTTRTWEPRVATYYSSTGLSPRPEPETHDLRPARAAYTYVMRRVIAINRPETHMVYVQAQKVKQYYNL
jgi:hypothetical protein